MTGPDPILVVDDEPLIVAALEAMLGAAGYKVCGFSDPSSAVKQLSKVSFSAIITDQRMPGMSGLELLAEARRLQPNASRLLMTGVLDLNTVIEAINQGEILRFIVKPWLREELLATMANAVHRHELLRDHAQLQCSAQEMEKRLLALQTCLNEKEAELARQHHGNAELSRGRQLMEARGHDFLGRLLDAFDPALAAQSRCVLQLSQAMSDLLELPPEERTVLESGARFFDAGLLRLPRSLIRAWQSTPEALEPADLEFIAQHPVLGAELAKAATNSDKIAELVRAHHERFDGKGYPDGLGTTEIPWLARLLAPAIAYATSALPANDALASIKTNAGTVFDPEAVLLFLRAVSSCGSPAKERTVQLSDLTPGMILARGFLSAHGVLLAPEGQRLTLDYLQKLKAYAATQRAPQTFTVYC
jgi:response regulator RpfG family c-di-GMP phosphodiesterase